MPITGTTSDRPIKSFKPKNIQYKDNSLHFSATQAPNPSVSSRNSLPIGEQSDTSNAQGWSQAIIDTTIQPRVTRQATLKHTLDSFEIDLPPLPTNITEATLDDFTIDFEKNEWCHDTLSSYEEIIQAEQHEAENNHQVRQESKSKLKSKNTTTRVSKTTKRTKLNIEDDFNRTWHKLTEKQILKIIASDKKKCDANENVIVSNQDILLGRGSQISHGNGNRLFRSLLSPKKNDYQHTAISNRTLFAKRAYATLRSLNSSFRFIENSTESDYTLVEPERSIEKIAQFLRQKP